eukprot:5191847-Amphidinium_carterae.1
MLKRLWDVGARLHQVIEIQSDIERLYTLMSCCRLHHHAAACVDPGNSFTALPPQSSGTAKTPHTARAAHVGAAMWDLPA